MIASSSAVARSGEQIFEPASQSDATRARRSARFVVTRFELSGIVALRGPVIVGGNPN
jgi:hypothetical protein